MPDDCLAGHSVTQKQNLRHAEYTALLMFCLASPELVEICFLSTDIAFIVITLGIQAQGKL